MKNNHLVTTEEEIQLTSTPTRESDLHSYLMTLELVDQLQAASPFQRQSASLCKLVARFGGAHFFYDEKGDFCLLTDFLHR